MNCVVFATSPLSLPPPLSPPPLPPPPHRRLPASIPFLLFFLLLLVVVVLLPFPPLPAPLPPPPPPFQGTPSPPGSPWPQPRQLRRQKDIFALHPSNFRFEGDVDNCDVIAHAINRYQVQRVKSGSTRVTGQSWFEVVFGSNRVTSTDASRLESIELAYFSRPRKSYSPDRRTLNPFTPLVKVPSLH